MQRARRCLEKLPYTAMKTDHITIGRNPALTYAILRGVALRNQKAARPSWLRRLFNPKRKTTTP